jgi:hypothetical protein
MQVDALPSIWYFVDFQSCWLPFIETDTETPICALGVTFVLLLPFRETLFIVVDAFALPAKNIPVKINVITNVRIAIFRFILDILSWFLKNTMYYWNPIYKYSS